MFSQDEQECDLEEVQTYLSVTRLTADRCRHESVTETSIVRSIVRSIWIFDGFTRRGERRQIGSIVRLLRASTSDYRWEVTRMLHGQPVARRCYRTLLECIGNIMAYEPVG